jgi:hypothetical protein
MSIHLCWPAETLRDRVRDIVEGCELLYARRLRNLPLNVSYHQEDRDATEKFVRRLCQQYPGLFAPERITYYLAFREGRSASRAEAEPTRRVFFNKLMVMPGGELCVGYRAGSHYRLYRTRTLVGNHYDAERFTVIRDGVKTYLAWVPEDAQTLESYIAAVQETLVPHSKRLQTIFRGLHQISDLIAAIHREVEETDCYFDPLYHCFGELFHFESSHLVRDLAERVLATDHSNCEIYRRVLDYLYRADLLAEYAGLLKRVIARDPVRFRVLIDALGFLDEDDSFLSTLEKGIAADTAALPSDQTDAAEIINRVRARKAILTERQS